LVRGHVRSELDEEGAIPPSPIAEDTGFVRFNREIPEMNENIELEGRVGRSIPDDTGHDVVFTQLTIGNRQSLSQGIFFAEIFQRARRSQDKIMLVGKSPPRISFDKREGEHLQEGRIDHGESLVERLVSVPDGSPAFHEPALAGDFGDGPDEFRPDRGRNKLLAARFLAGILVELDLDEAEELIVVFMKIVEGQLVRDEEIDE